MKTHRKASSISEVSYELAIVLVHAQYIYLKYHFTRDSQYLKEMSDYLEENKKVLPEGLDYAPEMRNELISYARNGIAITTFSDPILL